MSPSPTPRRLRVGIIGCGEVAQVNHIPNLNFLRHHYETTYLCDVSPNALAHCASMVRECVPKTTRDPEELCASPNVDVVLICNSDEYHVAHGVLALKYNKWCLIEKPLAVSFRDHQKIQEAERTSTGRVFVGTMRRYAHAFLEAVQEVGGMDKIMYARVRGIIGPNSNFVGQSCTYPVIPGGFEPANSEDRARLRDEQERQALVEEFGVELTDAARRQLRILAR